MYHLTQLLETIKHVPNCFNIFSHSDFAIYVFDDYAVHLIPEVRKALWERGYILHILLADIIGFVQVNDTFVQAIEERVHEKETSIDARKTYERSAKGSVS